MDEDILDPHSDNETNVGFEDLWSQTLPIPTLNTPRKTKSRRSSILRLSESNTRAAVENVNIEITKNTKRRENNNQLFFWDNVKDTYNEP